MGMLFCRVCFFSESEIRLYYKCDVSMNHDIISRKVTRKGVTQLYISFVCVCVLKNK